MLFKLKWASESLKGLWKHWFVGPIPQFLISSAWDEAWDFAFLASSELLLLVESVFENHWSSRWVKPQIFIQQTFPASILWQAQFQDWSYSGDQDKWSPFIQWSMDTNNRWTRITDGGDLRDLEWPDNNILLLALKLHAYKNYNVLTPKIISTFLENIGQRDIPCNENPLCDVLCVRGVIFWQCDKYCYLLYVASVTAFQKGYPHVPRTHSYFWSVCWFTVFPLYGHLISTHPSPVFLLNFSCSSFRSLSNYWFFRKVLTSLISSTGVFIDYLTYRACYIRMLNRICWLNEWDYWI